MPALTPETVAMLDASHGDMPTLLTGSAALPELGDIKTARALHMERELHQALDYGFALLDALDLPPLALDVIDDAIATLDALDAPDEDREPSLGWTSHVYQTAFNIGLTSDLEHDTADCEPSLASPERHPTVPWSGHWTERYVGRGSQDRQTNWADGSRQDHEADIADELHDGDGEDLEAEPDEPVLGATEEIDQTAWAESGDHDREFDATDCIDRGKTKAQYEAAYSRRPALNALSASARELRGRVQVVRDPDVVTCARRSVVYWDRPSLCNVAPLTNRVIVSAMVREVPV